MTITDRGFGHHSPDSTSGPAESHADKVERFLAAATPENTKIAYERAVDHYRIEWGGLLPASDKSVVRYLVEMADQYSISTLKLRLAGLADWHRQHGFSDPTKSPAVRKVMKGIARSHTQPPRQATPLAFNHLMAMVAALDEVIASSRGNPGRRGELLRSLRNRSLLLLGFWRGFRGDELTRATIEGVRVFRGERMEVYLPRSKTDSSGHGKSLTTPALRHLCPVEAYIDWIEEADLLAGPVFRKIDRWGNIAETGLTSKSLGPLLNQMAADAGLDVHLSTHSMRHGFANWAVDMGWDVLSIMKHVGWKNTDNAARYIPARNDYGTLAMGNALSSKSDASIATRLGDGKVLQVSVNDVTGVDESSSYDQ